MRSSEEIRSQKYFKNIRVAGWRLKREKTTTFNQVRNILNEKKGEADLRK